MNHCWNKSEWNIGEIIFMCTCLNVSGGNGLSWVSLALGLVVQRAWWGNNMDRENEKTTQSVRKRSYASSPMLPMIITPPMIPMRLYFGAVLESCFRITMCMSSWREALNKCETQVKPTVFTNKVKWYEKMNHCISPSILWLFFLVF